MIVMLSRITIGRLFSKLICVLILSVYSFTIIAVNSEFSGVMKTDKINTIKGFRINTIDEILLSDSIFSENNVKNEQKIDSIVPELFNDSIFDFQVNSEISYLKFYHFKNENAKISFYKGWIKDKERKKISDETLKLRKMYGNSDIITRENIAGNIIKNEEELIKLSSEIPLFYQKAREIESNYWKNASIDEVLRFREKIKFVIDSLENKIEKLSIIKFVEMTEKPDTIFIAVSDAKTDEDIAETGVVYKIRICSFKGKITKQNEELLKSLELIRKIENYTDEKGVTVYTTGNLLKWSEAELLRTQVQQEGAINASIEAYFKNKVISEEEAKAINKEE